MHAATPVLFLTQDDFLWQHWSALDKQQWPPTRGRDLDDLHRWRQQGHRVAVMDMGLPGLPAWEPQTWQPLLKGMRVIIASVRPNDEEGVQAFLCGVLGYCHAYAPAVTFMRVLQAVATGSVWMGASMVSRLLRQVDRIAPTPANWRHEALTERERAIALCVSQGESNSRIAATLGITERTVKAHLTAIFGKLGIEDRLQLALLVHGIKA